MIGAAAVAGAVIAASAWSVRGRASAVWAPSVWRGPADEPRVALTFDDGPSESTPRLLELLARHGARATFFQCGMHVRRLPRVAREVVSAGHELGNHTENHPLLCFRSRTFLRREIGAAQQAIQEATGVAPRWFRAPYGVRWPGLGAAQAEHGLTGVMWTVIGRDWTLPAGAIARRLCANASNGAILCLHDGRARSVAPDITPTLDAVDVIIPKLADRGFVFTTVSELLWLKQASQNE